jgi:hypothetical protein
MRKPAAFASFVLVSLAAAALVNPAGALASKATLWVAQGAADSGHGSSCTEAAYGSIQAAIDAAVKGNTIAICPGTYEEQLTIAKALSLVPASGAGTVTIALPASPAESSTSCDAAGAAEGGGTPEDEISICTSGKVSITDIAVRALWPAGTCDDNLYGILVAGGATLKATSVKLDGAGAQPINGCQGGVGIQVGMAWTHPVEVGHAALGEVQVSGYQKNGITVDGAGSSAKISHALVTGAGPTPEIAQNGIQISNGALGSIKASEVTGDQCRASSCGANPLSDYQSTGVLFYGAASGSSLVRSTMLQDDIGVYFASQSATQAHSPEVTIKSDLTAADIEGIVLDQGDASIEKTRIAGSGQEGIALLQYEGQSYGPDSTATDDLVTGQSLAGIKVFTDGAAGDRAGSFTISKSGIGRGSEGVLVNPSANFTVSLVEDEER